MEKQHIQSKQKHPPDIYHNFFVTISIALLFILPSITILLESITEDIPMHWSLVGKWFLFWASGIRLFTAGIRQTSNPEFTATKIFRFTTKESFVVIRELGFANIAIGSMGILSLINEHWRLLAAITSDIFFGLAALQHFSRRPDSFNEYVALIYDSIVFVILCFFCVLSFPQLVK